MRQIRLPKGAMRVLLFIASALALIAACQSPLRTAHAQQPIPRAAPPIVMQVAPSSNQEFSVQQGTSPAPFAYNITASRSQLNWQISGLPAWMSASATSGRTPATVTFTINSSQLGGGDYYTSIGFVNTNTHQGDTQRAVHLTIVVPPPPKPTWSFVASAFQESFSRIGDLINFRYVVTNTGAIAISTIAIESSLGSSGCAADTLAPGDQFGCEYDYAVRQIDIDAGSVSDHAIAKSLANPPVPDPIQVITAIPYVAPTPPTPGTVDILTSDTGDRLVTVEATPPDYLTDELPSVQPLRAPRPSELLRSMPVQKRVPGFLR